MIYEERFSIKYPCPFLQGRPCTGDACPLWRWFDAPEPEIRIIDHVDPLAKFAPDERPDGVPADYEFFPAEDNDDACWVELEESAIARRRGFCGGGGLPKYAE